MGRRGDGRGQDGGDGWRCSAPLGGEDEATGSERRGEVRPPDPDLDRGRGEGRAVVGRGSGASRGGVGCVGARVRGLRGGSGPAGWAGGGQLGHLAQQGGSFFLFFC